MKVCPECGEGFRPESRQQVYCRPGCALQVKRKRDNKNAKEYYQKEKENKNIM